MARAKEARNHEGKKDILNRAKEHEKARDHAMQQDPWFDYAEGMLQIAIFFLSVSILGSIPCFSSLEVFWACLDCYRPLMDFFI